LRKNNRFTIEEVRSNIGKLGFTLLSDKYRNNKEKLILRDNNGYTYFVSLDNIKNHGSSSAFHISNPFTLENIKLWCILNKKPFELISNKYENNNKYLKWKCLLDNCGEIFSAIWNNIYHGKGCGYCHGMQVGISNCLATLNPELAKEWHPTKNGDLTPYDVTHGSHKKIWWQCKDNPKHEWCSSVVNRNRATKNGCPYCSHKIPSEDYNLLVCNPKLAYEWNYNKNIKIPEDYCPSSGVSVWWKCSVNLNHEWKATILNRNSSYYKTGCPICSESKGEKRVSLYLKNRGFISVFEEEYKELTALITIKNESDKYIVPQKSFDGLLGVGNGLLSYDFYLPEYNLLIEYQGLQHEKYVKGFHKNKKAFEIQVEHDKRKKEYTLSYGYNFLEIWYYDFNNIETILQNTLIKGVI